MLYFSGAWNQTNRKVYNIPDLGHTNLKQPKQETEHVTPDEEDALVEKLATRKPHAAGSGEWQYQIHDALVMLIDTGARYNESACSFSLRATMLHGSSGCPRAACSPRQSHRHSPPRSKRSRRVKR